MNYRITKQYRNGSEQLDTTSKSFEEARRYAEEKAKEQALMQVHVTFRVYEWDDVRYSIESSPFMQEIKNQSSSDSQGRSSGVSFRPTPLELSPRPKGSMPKHFSENDKTDPDKK